MILYIPVGGILANIKQKGEEMSKVTVYSTPTCPWCTKAKNYLKENDIEFTDKDVSVDQAGAMEMIRKSNQRGVPVIDIDGTILIGFDKPNIDRLLKL